MKNFIRGVNLFLCLVIVSCCAFFCYVNTTSSDKNDSYAVEHELPIADEIYTTELNSYKTWGAEKMGVDDYSQYLLDIVEADNGYDKLEEIVVAVLDTGIDTDHPWFTDRFLYDENDKILGLDYTADQTDVNLTKEYKFEDDNGHGTHCAGIICDMTLPNVKILPVKIMYGEKGTGDANDAVSAIKELIEMKKNNGINIVAMNMSLGGTITLPDHEEILSQCTTAIKNAYDAGIFSVVAAGNKNIDACSDLPAMIERAITVSAIDSNLIKADFSNFGECIDVCAPGVAVESAYYDGATDFLSGTSMAAPHISAYIALLKSDLIVNYSMEDIEDILTNEYQGLETVKDLGDSGEDVFYGYGLPILDNLMQHVAYTVNFYLEPLYDLQSNSVPDYANYDLQKSFIKYGVFGCMTEVDTETIQGFTATDFEQQTISDDTVINVYYKRNKYKIEIKTSESGIQSVSGAGEYLYGATINLNVVIADGYLWEDWEIIQCTSTKFYQNFKCENITQSFEMPDSNLTLAASAQIKLSEIKFEDLDWPDLLTWGGGFAAVIVLLMFISRPRMRKR